MAILEKNMKVLGARFPRLYDLILKCEDKDKVVVFRAQDGCLAYGYRTNGHVTPLTDPVSPSTSVSRQLQASSSLLQDFTRPITIIGLYPGDEIPYLFQLSKKDTSARNTPQEIRVFIDSIHCLWGLLNGMDITELLNSRRVKLIWHEDVVEYVDHLDTHPEESHIFTLVSCAPASVQRSVAEPLANLVRKRDLELQILIKDNEAYYNAVTDAQLADIISGKGPRPPRLLMPTCSWSTVTQYSARDTAAMLRKLGWDVLHLNVDTMLTPYCVAKSINEFKPDIFLFINHLRTEADSIYPRDMMFVSWIQDTVPFINKRKTAEQWNLAALAPNPATGVMRRRDLIIGYTAQLRKYGYAADRLQPMNMIVNTDIFRPHRLTPQQKARYCCDVCYASNASRPTEQIVRDNLVPALAEFGFNESLLVELHDLLWSRYRAGNTYTNYLFLEDEFRGVPHFAPLYDSLSEDSRDEVLQTLFWSLNDPVYRHVVLEWLDDHARANTGFKLHLYGHGWDRHPQFAAYAKGEIEHGDMLNAAYRAAEYCLHLNSREGNHQRLFEICASGATPLTRVSSSHTSAEDYVAKLNDKAFAATRRLLAANPEMSPGELQDRIRVSMTPDLRNSPWWLAPGPSVSLFSDRKTLEGLLTHESPTNA